MDFNELFGSKRVKIAELGDWIAPVISLVSEPSVPWAYFISIKSAEQTSTKEDDVAVLDKARILKALRENKGLSQQRLAEIVGVSQSSISSYETGLAGVPLPVAQKMAGALSVEAETLAFSTGLIALKAKAEANPESALWAAQSAYQLSQDDTLTEEQRGLAAELCASLLATVENALGVTFDEAAEEETTLPAATRSAEQPVDTGRDANGLPIDRDRDIRIARGR